MSKKKSFHPFSAVIPIIIGAALIKEFNIDTLSFNNTALALIYMATIAVSVFLIYRNYKNSQE